MMQGIGYGHVKYEIRSIDVDRIRVGNRLRSPRQDRVSALAASMREIGLRTPISIRITQDKEGADEAVHSVPVLVAGATRLAAAKKLGWARIDCFVLQPADLEVQLWEIDENLSRAELTPAETAEHMARRKELWEQKLVAENGRNTPIFQSAGRGYKGFAQETADRTGQDKREINKAVARGQKIVPDVLRDVKGTKMDTGVTLDMLAKLTPDEQRRAIKVGMGRTACAETKEQQARAPTHEAIGEIANILAAHIPSEHWGTLKNGLFMAGYKRLAYAFTQLIGASIVGRTRNGSDGSRAVSDILFGECREKEMKEPAISTISEATRVVKLR
jgi:hypothetical protein